jgi:cobalt-zinc-cadmium efflux system outer membrane protein
MALATAMQTPDLTPEAALTRVAAPEFDTGWRLGLSLAVPIFTRHRAGVRLEEATLAQLTAERTAAVARITGDVTAAAALANAERQQYLRYRDEIVPQAIEVERLAEDSYRLGQTGIAAYLQALQASRDVRLRTIQAAADYQSALADLERAIGAPLP